MKQTLSLHADRKVPGNAGFTFVKLLLFIVIFVCVISAAWVYFLPVVLASALQKNTGFGVKVTEMSFNPFTARVELSGLVLTNPESFPKREFLEVTSFSANGRLATFFSSRPEFDYARIDVAYVALVRDSSGVLNAQLFNTRLNRKAADREAPVNSVVTEPKVQGANDVPATKGGAVPVAKAEPKPEAKKAGAADTGKAKSAEPIAKDKKEGADKTAAEAKPVPKPEPFYIKRLELRLDRLIVADYAGATPDVREYNCKLCYTFNDVTDPKQLMAPFAFKSLQSVGMAIRALIPGSIGKAVGAVTQPDDPMIKPREAQTEDPVKTVVEKLEESPKP